MIKRSAIVKITTVRRRAIRVAGVSPRAGCPGCERGVGMLTRSQAAEILQVDDLTVDGLIATRQVHAILTVSGNFCICKDSLFVE